MDRLNTITSHAWLPQTGFITPETGKNGNKAPIPEDMLREFQA